MAARLAPEVDQLDAVRHPVVDQEFRHQARYGVDLARNPVSGKLRQVEEAVDQDDRATGEQGREDLVHRHVEGEGRRGEGGSEEVPVDAVQGQLDEPGEVAVRRAAALRLSGAAGGVDDPCGGFGVGGPERHLLRARLLVAQVGHIDDGPGAGRYGVPGGGVDQDHAGVRVPQHVRGALGRVVGVERQVPPAGQQDPRHGGDRVGGAAEQQGHRPFGDRRRAVEGPDHRPGPGRQLRVGERAAGAPHRRTVGAFRQRCLERLQRGRGLGGKGRREREQVPAAGRTEDVHGEDVGVGVGHHGVQHPQVRIPHGGEEGSVEEVGVVGPEHGDAAVDPAVGSRLRLGARDDHDVEVHLCRAVVQLVDGGGRSGQLQVRHPGVIGAEHDLEARVRGGIAVGVETADQFQEGELLVCRRFGHRLAGRVEQCSERGVRRDRGA